MMHMWETLITKILAATILLFLKGYQLHFYKL